MITTPSKSVDAPRQPKNMTEVINPADVGLEFLNLKEVARILRVAPISVYRLIARQLLPVYRASRKLLFKKQDVIDYLENSRRGPSDYGSPKN
jgi:excisionase family DNA binding protein